MASDMKKLDSLGKQIEQYESHLAMVRNDITSLSTKRDAAKKELEDTQAKSREVIAKAQAECEDIKGVILAQKKEIEALREQLAQDRQALNQEKAGISVQQDNLEMKRRDLDNDRRKVAGFIQIIEQAVKAWR